MKRMELCMICLTVLATTAAAQEPNVPCPLPAITVNPSPENPTAADTLILNLTGTWPDAAIPEKFDASVRDERFADCDRTGCILIDMVLPGYEDCNAPLCAEVPTDWKADVTIGVLSPGEYLVFARALGCAQIGPYEQIGEVRIGLSAGAPGDNPSGRLGPGTFVVLLDETLGGLQTGQSGVVVCCDSADYSGATMVSFFLYGQGTHDTYDSVDAASMSLPMASARWIDTKATALGVPVNECGTLREGELGCVLFDADDGQTYNLVGADMLSSAVGPAGEFDFGDRARVHGALQITGPRTAVADLCPEQNGDIHGAILTPCVLVGALGACPGDELFFEPTGYCTWRILLRRDPACPAISRTFSGCTTIAIDACNDPDLSAAATPLPGVGGTWDATFTPLSQATDPGVFEVCVSVKGLNLADIPIGPDVEVGRLVFDIIEATEE